ncbi:MAG: NAD(+)/NADH kinase [Spirochaetales bacterium]
MPRLDREVHNVLVIANLHKARAGDAADSVARALESRGVSTHVFKFEGKPDGPPEGEYDLAFSLGGDGTVLYASRILSHKGTPIIGVNMGDFGFLTEITEDEWLEAFENYRAGKLAIAERIIQLVRVFRNGTQIADFVGLNDAVITAAGIAKIIRLTVGLQNVSLGHYRADGIIVATPTGSTAHSAAAGGPILDPRVDAMIINPICPFTLSHRPIVVPGSETIEIGVDEQQRTEVLMTVDGQIVMPLEPGDRVVIGRADYCARIVRALKRDFYDVLRGKLKWSGEPGPSTEEEL